MFFYYNSQIMRDEVFANEKSKKIVTYAKFEIEINIKKPIFEISY